MVHRTERHFRFRFICLYYFNNHSLHEKQPIWYGARWTSSHVSDQASNAYDCTKWTRTHWERISKLSPFQTVSSSLSTSTLITISTETAPLATITAITTATAPTPTLCSKPTTVYNSAVPTTTNESTHTDSWKRKRTRTKKKTNNFVKQGWMIAKSK